MFQKWLSSQCQQEPASYFNQYSRIFSGTNWPETESVAHQVSGRVAESEVTYPNPTSAKFPTATPTFPKFPTLDS